ncbi:helix-turn-helix transcriptional regulator [Paenibacillus kobensis]|uniref:helix-turn-helix transcriptional regulator n=1 Tax=Paenibacillus kobensis TaxID=59841 RepID=UPI001FED096F|nr:helix-turn-helix transcriptional regulator [Paenibacillus kobensis]
MDDILICIFNDQNRLLSDTQLNELSTISHIAHLEDEKSLNRVLRQKPYRLVAIVTMNNTLPPAWQHVKPLLTCPLFMMGGVKSNDLPALIKMLESLKDSMRITKSTDHFTESLAFIEENLFDHELSLEKVAAQMFVSKYHYSRIFQRYIGTGYKEYVINKRMQKAMSLLKKGYQVTEVCFAVGYNDLTHFARVFKKTFGGNPSTFRAKYEYVKMEVGALA